MTAQDQREEESNCVITLVAEGPYYEAAVHAVLEAKTSHDNDGYESTNIVEDKLKFIQGSNNNEYMISVATKFLEKACPQYFNAIHDTSSPLYDEASISDRLVKIGRCVTATLSINTIEQTNGAKEGRNEVVLDMDVNSHNVSSQLACLVKECEILAPILKGENLANHQVPKVRYGKTELQMPVISLGCMRFQQSWNRGSGEPIKRMDQVTKECQDNLVRIMKYAFAIGINHVETAQGYGCSELQIGTALEQLFNEGYVKREDLILQTKGGISKDMTPSKMRAQVAGQLQRLKVDYVDIYSLHGLNLYDHYEWLFRTTHTSDDATEEDQGTSLMDVMQQLKKEGTIRNLGFSTHGPVAVISKLIESDCFDSINLHYHWLGSYTNTGDGNTNDDSTNLHNVKLAHARDMGVFVISAYDKGGRLYAPSNQLRSLTLPEIEPFGYGALWLMHHNNNHPSKAHLHTQVCGAGRPSDLDQPLVAALLFSKHESKTLEMVQRVESRLNLALTQVLGEEWAHTWYKGVPNWLESKYGTQLATIVWLHNIIKAFGMLDYSRERYQWYENFVNNKENDPLHKTKDQNIQDCGGMGWGWTPGFGIDVKHQLDYSDDLKDVPDQNLQSVKAALAFVQQWCGKDENGKLIKEPAEIPVEWQTAYDMRPWIAFPERP